MILKVECYYQDLLSEKSDHLSNKDIENEEKISYCNDEMYFRRDTNFELVSNFDGIGRSGNSV